MATATAQNRSATLGAQRAQLSQLQTFTWAGKDKRGIVMRGEMLAKNANLVKAGQSAGVLDTVLDTIATYKENLESLKGKIKKALFYPAVVLAVALLVSCVLLIFVVPQFQSVFKQFGADLPAFTQLIVNAS